MTNAMGGGICVPDCGLDLLTIVGFVAFSFADNWFIELPFNFQTA